MKNKKGILYALSAFGALTLMVSSCSKDDPAPVNPKLSFSETSATHKEGEGTIELDIKLDKAAANDIVISYSFDDSYAWSAIEKSTVSANQAYDFEDVTAGEVTIAKGQMSGTIQLNLVSDFSLERDELIDIVIDDVKGTNIDITRSDEIKILLKQENGTYMYLDWANPTETDSADMDLVIRRGASIGEWASFTGSVTPGSFPGEDIFIPWTTQSYGYGASYVFYEGNLDPLKFGVSFIDYVNGNYDYTSAQQFTATYHAANVNKWTDPNTTVVAQTFNVTKNGITELSDISVGATSSRMPTSAALDNTLTFKRAPRQTQIPAEIKAYLKSKRAL